MDTFVKYPRTLHLEGSKGSKDGVPLSSFKDGVLVFEEKIDATQSGLSFDAAATPRIQSRGHWVQQNDPEFHMMWTWANAHDVALYELLGDRYIMFGEWTYLKHTVFYDQLPHYFLEFDIYDREKDYFLSTTARMDFLKGSPVVSVPVVGVSRVLPKTIDDIRFMIQKSLYISGNQRETLHQLALQEELNPIDVAVETDLTGASEGLYVKHEKDGQVIGRYKFIRRDFLSTIEESGSHWAARPGIRNQLADGVDIFRGA